MYVLWKTYFCCCKEDLILSDFVIVLNQGILEKYFIILFYFRKKDTEGNKESTIILF
jgi:hypothetical protein